MFARWAEFLVRARWAVLAAGLALVVLGATWGTGVFGALSSGGVNHPPTPPHAGRGPITAKLRNQDAANLAPYSSPPATPDDPAAQAAVTRAPPPGTRPAAGTP